MNLFATNWNINFIEYFIEYKLLQYALKKQQHNKCKYKRMMYTIP